MQFQDIFTEIPTPDLILVIEVKDVKESSDTGSLSSGSSGCCDDVSTIRWMVPAFTAVVLVVLIVSCSILLIWCVELFSICRILLNAWNTKLYHEKHTKWLIVLVSFFSRIVTTINNFRLLVVVIHGIWYHNNSVKCSVVN